MQTTTKKQKPTATEPTANMGSVSPSKTTDIDAKTVANKAATIVGVTVDNPKCFKVKG